MHTTSYEDDSFSMSDSLHNAGDASMHHMGMSMAMTFSGLFDYQVTVLWDWWKVQTPAQYLATSIAVFLAVIFYHGLRMLQSRVSVGLPPSPSSGGGLQAPLLAGNRTRGGQSQKSRFIHAALGGACYGLALLLMLVGMTYNTGLFFVLCLGYAVGDYMFAERGGKTQGTDHCH